MKKVVIVYGNIEKPIRKKALEQVSSAVLEQTYEYPVCVKYSDLTVEPDVRYIYIGTKEDNPYIKENSKSVLSKAEEYHINVSNETVIIEGYDDAGLLYGCADFYNKYIVENSGLTNLNDPYYSDVFSKEELPEFDRTSAPSVKNRGIWTWGHVIYNYKDFIDNMLRLKLNTLTLWNDFAPVNAREMIDYAHSCNIQVIWGYPWLWGPKDYKKEDMAPTPENVDPLIEKFEKEYAPLGVDGIYFQSFTEFEKEEFDGVLIADAVTKFVNYTASRFFEKFGEMELQFGLHASSVKEKLEYIKNTDPRIRIVWEDCGSFPFAYGPYQIENFDQTFEFTKKITNLREGEKFGAVTKGFVNLDWAAFTHPTGAYYIDKSTKSVIHNRVDRKHRTWHFIQAFWITNADKAYDMVKLMCEQTKGDLYITPLVEDGLFEENVMFPVALYSEMLWDTNANLKHLMSSVALRSYVEFA